MLRRHILAIILYFLCVSMPRAADGDETPQIDNAEIMAFLKEMNQRIVKQHKILARIARDDDTMWVPKKYYWLYLTVVVTTLMCVVASTYLFPWKTWIKDWNLGKHGKWYLEKVWKIPGVSRRVIWALDQITVLREDGLFLVIGSFVADLLKGGFEPSTLVTIVTALFYHAASRWKESAQDGVLRISCNYWERHPMPEKRLVGEVSWKMKKVCPPLGGDLLRAEMTVEEAKLKCMDLPGCRAFCHKGGKSDDKVLIFFKDRIEFLEGSDQWSEDEQWTTYVREDFKKGDLVDYCSSFGWQVTEITDAVEGIDERSFKIKLKGDALVKAEALRPHQCHEFVWRWADVGFFWKEAVDRNLMHWSKRLKKDELVQDLKLHEKNDKNKKRALYIRGVGDSKLDKQFKSLEEAIEWVRSKIVEEEQIQKQGEIDTRFMFNALSEDRVTEEVFGTAFPPTLALVASQTTSPEDPFVKLESSQAREVFAKLGALVSDMNSMDLLKSSVNEDTPSEKIRCHTFVLGVCFETSPIGQKKFRIMIMEENQLRKCLGGDDPQNYKSLECRDQKDDRKILTNSDRSIRYEPDNEDPFYPHHGGNKMEGCATPLLHQREDRLRVMRIMANLWFNSNGGQDVKMKPGDDGLKSFKLTRKELKDWVEKTSKEWEIKSNKLTKGELEPQLNSGSFVEVAKDAELEDQLKAFFNVRACKYWTKEDDKRLNLVDVAAKKLQERFGVVLKDMHLVSSQRPTKTGKDLEEWKYNYFFSRLVIIDKDGRSHKLKECDDSKEYARKFKWDALVDWLEEDLGASNQRFDYPVMARLTPVKKRNDKNREFTNADSDGRMRRGLTSIDVYGLAE